MTITDDDIIDPLFTTLSETEQTYYLNIGNIRFVALCTKYGVDNDSIETDPIPFTPYRIGILCVLIAICTDKLGMDWQELANGGTIDTKKQKLDVLTAELNDLLGSFTPEMCGYDDDDDDTNNSTSSIGSHFMRS